MTDFAKVANEVLQILRSFNYTVLLYNDEGMRVSEPDDARRYFDKSKNLMVSIVDEDDNSCIECSYGKKTHANDIMGLVQALKTMATKSALIFSAKQFGKSIEPQDTSELSSITERQDRTMILTLIEGMYGTTRSSYLRLENARMIVRHSKKINDSMIGARGRCVESIFIENASGERLLFPSTHLAPARAMTQHVNHGGTFSDPVGGQIMQMTTEFANLAQASSFVASNAIGLTEGAMEVREACRGKMREFRKSFGRLSKPSSYTKESANIVERANALTENGTEIDETSINEIRRLLNDADLPREVYECVSKAMSDMKESTPITEADEVEGDEDDYEPKAATTVGVLGQRVDIKALDQLIKQNKLYVTAAPPASDMPQFPDQFTALCYKLGRWVPVVADVTLANLLSHIVNQMTNYLETGEVPNVGVSRTSNSPTARKETEWRKSMHTMATIGLAALKARKIKAPVTVKAKKTETFAGAGVPSVVEHYAWLEKFDPDMILSEDFGMGDWGDPMGDGYDNVKNQVIANFEPQDFATSPEVTEMLGDKDSQNPEENHLDHHEVMEALRAYVQRQIQEIGSEDSFSLYMTDSSDDEEIADSLFDDASEALQGQGWMLQSEGNVENEMQESEFDDDDDAFDLTMSDIVIPTHNQGDSLVHQVSKSMVDDPDHPDRMMRPDSNYISRLQTLAGVQNGGLSGKSY